MFAITVAVVESCNVLLLHVIVFFCYVKAIAHGHIRKISAYRAFAVLAILWAPLTGEQLPLDAMEVHL